MLKSPRDIALLVVLALAIGFMLARIAPARAPAARPASTPAPIEALASPAPTPEPVDDDRVWQQPLIAGCALATGDVFLVSSGGGIAQFDGKHWNLVDDTLRQLRAAACVPGLFIGVGDNGKIVRLDPALRTIRPDTIGHTDLVAVGALDAREIVAAGSDLEVIRLHAGSWDPVGGGGAGRSWRAILPRSAGEVWLAGDAGRLFFFDGTEFTDRSIPNGPDLAALALFGGDVLVGAADGRLYTVTTARAARPLAPVGRVPGAIRALVSAADGVFVLGDELRHLSAAGALTVRSHGLACPAVGLFSGPRGELWVIGRSGTRGGLAHYDGTSWTKIGRC